MKDPRAWTSVDHNDTVLTTLTAKGAHPRGQSLRSSHLGGLGAGALPATLTAYGAALPHYLVDIRGDAYRAMGLLAKVGIQNIVSSEPTKLVTARLSADDPESARGSVLAALGGEAFTIECRWHDRRHFCATQLLELGLDHFAVSIQLGHTDGGALVMERYGHPSVDAARQRLLQAFRWTEAETGSATGSRRAET